MCIFNSQHCLCKNTHDSNIQSSKMCNMHILCGRVLIVMPNIRKWQLYTLLIYCQILYITNQIISIFLFAGEENKNGCNCKRCKS